MAEKIRADRTIAKQFLVIFERYFSSRTQEKVQPKNTANCTMAGVCLYKKGVKEIRQTIIARVTLTTETLLVIAFFLKTFLEQIVISII